MKSLGMSTFLGGYNKAKIGGKRLKKNGGGVIQKQRSKALKKNVAMTTNCFSSIFRKDENF